ncbi:hypothetical protein SPRG_14489 [Saprolegnia parasitica CBS 223.65]|uniref:Uncharacterized protein n=1 Tax=Saprolegnia parasitica (strain CBS 223.65) TaxID=695850 RepID=A0A067BPS2_SAPPC|nr:hypothetical protein SPRG_14489 [Saprolegnia parasitica CBS 223.65]KDO20243.1 hypothetical protein SPRG_14489 [Saprolegnia parasitica CBS 223.65]|eukprot:XP_012209055.1 hypothetical protein SPRG_14489 [Saprolegnia parasitica CBS 223.65]
MANSGRWTAAELKYLDHLVGCYLTGILDDSDDEAERLTLRQYVARQLRCDPMRVTKRLKKGKMLANARLQANFNRRVYHKLIDYSALDVERLMALKDARNKFLAELESKVAKKEGSEPRVTRGYLSLSEQLNGAPGTHELQHEAHAMLLLRGNAEAVWTI